MQDLFVGVKAISVFLRVHPRTVYRYLRTGRLPVRKDSLGRWVLVKDDYLRNLRSTDGYHTGSEG